MNIFKELSFAVKPSRANATDAGLDIFVPMPAMSSDAEEVTKWKDNTLNKSCGASFTSSGIIIKPHGRVLFSSGWCFEIAKNCMLMVSNKSGVSTKKGLVFGAQVGDHGYTGQMHISLVNTTNEWVEIKFGEKIVQLILVPILTPEINIVVDKNDLYTTVESSRGDGGFGSTGT